MPSASAIVKHNSRFSASWRSFRINTIWVRMFRPETILK